MILVTGSSGFIGSALISKLNSEGISNIIACDEFETLPKKVNYSKKNIEFFLHRNALFEWLETNGNKIEYIYHIGARTDTTEKDNTVFDVLNYKYSINLYQFASQYNIPFVYASSAATYGNGENGYDDNEDLIKHLKPLNPYAVSKQRFDLWILENKLPGHYFVGLKFFNVFGPNEYHKGRMASVIFHAFHQIKNTGKLKLFKSHREDYDDGGQMRDFVYVKDVCSVLHFLYSKKIKSGIYNLGSGQARTFKDLGNAVFKAMNINANVEYIDTPEDIRNAYQYYTCANMNKLFSAGYTEKFTNLEEAVEDYVKNYLSLGLQIL